VRRKADVYAVPDISSEDIRQITEKASERVMFDEAVVFNMAAEENRGGEWTYVRIPDGMRYDDDSYLQIRDRIAGMEKRVLFITCRKYLIFTNRLLWECPNAVAGVCVDADCAYPVEQYVTRENRMLWDFQAAKSEADDFASMSGWNNSYDNTQFAEEEIREYINDAVLKVRPCLTEDAAALEVGIGSGMIALELSRYCGQYDGCDISETVLEILRARAAKEGVQNMELFKADADKVHELGRQYDVILSSSVTEYFSGYNYMRAVVESGIRALKDSGHLFFFDVFDLAEKKNYMDSVHDYSLKHPEADYKRDFAHELYIPYDFWRQLGQELPEIAAVNITGKIGDIDNEINRYRYDVELVIDKAAQDGAEQHAETAEKAEHAIGRPQFGFDLENKILIER